MLSETHWETNYYVKWNTLRDKLSCEVKYTERQTIMLSEIHWETNFMLSEIHWETNYYVKWNILRDKLSS